MDGIPAWTVFVGVATLLLGLYCGQSGATHGEETHGRAVTLPDTMDLAYQDTLRLPNEGDWLTFDTLVHDSRCPAGATCVWEGNAEVNLSLHQAGRRHTLALNAHPSFAMDSTLAGLTIAFVDLTPYPHVDSSYRADRYTLRLFISNTTSR